jgi:hypothetical protein
LRERHVAPPEHDTDHDERDGRAQRKKKVRDDQARDSDREQSASADPIGQSASRKGSEGIDDVHHHHNGGYERDCEPNILGAQDEKRLGEPGKAENRGDADHDPETAGQALGIRKAQARLGISLVPARLLNGKDHHSNGDECRRNRDPKDEMEIVGAKHHHGDRGEWSDKSADSIERLAQAETGAPQLSRCKIG